MLASEIKAESVLYRPLPLDLRVDFLIGYSRHPSPFWKMHRPRGVYTNKYITCLPMVGSLQNLDQLYVPVSSAHKTAPRDMTCTALKAT